MDGDSRPPDQRFTYQSTPIGQRQSLGDSSESPTCDKQREAVRQPQAPDLEGGQAEAVPCRKQSESETNGQNPIHWDTEQVNVPSESRRKML